MRLKYGNYSHDLDEAAVVIDRQALLNQAKIPYGYKETWRISGFLQAASQSALTTSIQSLKSAYAVHGQTAQLLLDDGTRTAHVLDSNSSVGGVIVTQLPSFPVGNGAEYSTFRSYAITLEAEYGVDDEGAASGLISWQETLTITGGGPRYVLLELRNGPPQKQLVSEQTICRATQTGRAVGYLNYPTPPGPTWPAHEDFTARQVSYDNPEESGIGAFRFAKNFPVSWSYQFAAAVQLNGRPHRRPF